MNKYELGIKIDQIKKLAAKKDYAEAAAIAKELNWSKVKDWQSLATRCLLIRTDSTVCFME